jgi:4-alpha-glucanotransferase
MTDAWSITDGFWDIEGNWHPTSPDTRDALLTAMDADGREGPPPLPPMWFLPAGAEAPLRDSCDLELEDGTTLIGLIELPRDLPLGYHQLQPRDGGPATTLVVTPRRCRLPGRAWGWATQLYALRSRQSWGMGDLGDLRQLAKWSRELGAGVIVINPLHASAPTRPQQPSPYSPTSRLWRNINYLRVADVPGADALADELAAVAATGRSLNDLERIDRDAVHALKIEALERLFARFQKNGRDRHRIEAWVRRQGDALHRFAVWSALAERHGPDWTGWPTAFRHPASPAVAAFARQERARVDFHEWCQWQVSEQLEAASLVGVALVADLAVGFDPAGADAWAFQDLLAIDWRVGAPPDTFNPQGQNWGLPPFVPWKLRQARYQPFIDTLRAGFAHGGGMRIDHVMGLFRIYWIPPGARPADGAYVRYPFHDLLDLLALEAARAGAFVVGEDLGTVEDEVRDELMARDILSYRVLWFEEGPPPTFPQRALASVTTHDLPTMAGVWTGADLSHRQQLGHAADDEDDGWFRSRIHQATGLNDDASTEEVLIATHEALAGAPSLIVVATLDDAVGMVDRPNLPGTIDEWPNWRIPLHRTLEEIEADPLVLSVAHALDQGVRRSPDLPSPP